MPSLKLLADDLTGALDTSAELVGVFGPLSVVWSAASLEGQQSFAIDSATRERTAGEAFAVVREIAPLLADADIAFKKIDSLLRGPWVAELDACLRMGLWDACIVAPAFVHQGRITRSGQQYAKARDGSWNAVGKNIIEQLLERGLEAKLASPTAALENGISVFDAETEADLDHVAQFGKQHAGRLLWCGSGGLANALGRGTDVSVPARLETPVLGIFGSDHAATAAQLSMCEGVVIESSDIRQDLDRIRRALDKGVAFVRLDTPGTVSRTDAAEHFARAVAQLCESIDPPKTLTVAGGETLKALTSAVGARALQVQGRLEPGLPKSVIQGGRWAGVDVLSKSGAFGACGFVVETAQAERPDVREMTLKGSDMAKRHLAITMGDPAGIGPEIIIKACAKLRDRLDASDLKLLIIGSHRALDRANRQIDAGLDIAQVGVDDNDWPNLSFLQADEESDAIAPGVLSADGGRFAYKAVEQGVRLSLSGRVGGIVTAPLNKEALNKAGYHYPGHTEMLAALTGVRGSVMLLAHGNMRVSHVSTHVALQDVPSRLTPERLRLVIDLTHKALSAMGIARPKIAVAALNPHAGEGGLFGRQDIDVSKPTIEQAVADGLDVIGPIPGDTIFVKLRAGQYDAVVAMYHDQGHIPVKLLGFEIDPVTGKWQELSGVNITLGLPIIRTSVDHGTAFDIAGKGIANERSMIEAIEYAERLAGNA